MVTYVYMCLFTMCMYMYMYRQLSSTVVVEGRLCGWWRVRGVKERKDVSMSWGTLITLSMGV